MTFKFDRNSASEMDKALMIDLMLNEFGLSDKVHWNLDSEDEVIITVDTPVPKVQVVQDETPYNIRESETAVSSTSKDYRTYTY